MVGAALDTDSASRSSLQPPMTPSQPDSSSCGLYMLIGLWCCMSGVSLSSRLDARPVNHWRNVLTLCLYRGGIGRACSQ